MVKNKKLKQIFLCFVIMLTSVFQAGLAIDDTGAFVYAPEDRIIVEEFLEVSGLSSAPPLSSAGEGVIYFDSNTNRFRLSENTSTYSNLMDFSNGGEAGGTARSLGNTDGFDLNFLTSGSNRITIKSSGRVGIGIPSPNQILEVNGTIKSIETQATTAATINIDWTQGNQQTVLLSQVGHTVAFNASTVFPGQIFRLVVCQDGSGGRTITTWPGEVRFPNGATTVSLSSAANTCDVLSFIATDAAGVPGATRVLGTIVRGFNVI